MAGFLVLSRFTAVGDDGATALPTRTFGYTYITEHYEGDVYHPYALTNCGPSWNTGNGSGCHLWSQSYAGNSWYLNAASNGLGLRQSFTWAAGRNNTHGVPGDGSNNADPLYCNSHQTGYPCNEADDQNWGRAILTQREGDVIQATAGGNTTSFTYDDAGRQLTMSDPDRGNETYSYDADGNLTHAVDARAEHLRGLRRAGPPGLAQQQQQPDRRLRQL